MHFSVILDNSNRRLHSFLLPYPKMGQFYSTNFDTFSLLDWRLNWFFVPTQCGENSLLLKESMRSCSTKKGGVESIIRKTRQVYNLFQDLWNKAMVFFRKVQKKLQKTVQTFIQIFHIGAAPLPPPNLPNKP